MRIKGKRLAAVADALQQQIHHACDIGDAAVHRHGALVAVVGEEAVHEQARDLR